jgi:hypothetical protein
MNPAKHAKTGEIGSISSVLVIRLALFPGGGLEDVRLWAFDLPGLQMVESDPLTAQARRLHTIIGTEMR